MTRIDEIRKQHVALNAHSWEDIAYLLDELERTQARLAKAEAGCEAVLNVDTMYIRIYLKEWQESREHPEHADGMKPFERMADFAEEHGGG